MQKPNNSKCHVVSEFNCFAFQDLISILAGCEIDLYAKKRKILFIRTEIDIDRLLDVFRLVISKQYN